MKIDFSINDSKNEDKLISFLEKNCNFRFVEIKNAFELKEINLIILKKDITDNNILEILKNPNYFNSQIFAHKSLQDKIPLNYKVIFYPTKISTFQNTIKKYQEINLSYKDIYLSQDSFLINSNNQKKIYVTEKEFEIISLFFKKKVIKKELIQEEILNLQKTVDTKSLDSHLTRIRNKFLEIDSGLNISSVKNDCLEIKKLV